MSDPREHQRERLIVALDVPTASDARHLFEAIGDSARIYKVGKQLFTAEGPRVVRDLVESGRQVFLDLKYHDIPNTVAGAVREAGKLGVSLLTVHASGGSKMLRAAVDAARDYPKLKILAVTVLTSMDAADLAEVGVARGVSGQVIHLAGLALKAGCAGVVASAQEAARLRAEFGANFRGQFGSDFLIVTPGVRPAGADAGDQARVVTPAQAIAAGATHIVVGRPITEAKDPGAAARAIVAEM